MVADFMSLELLCIRLNVGDMTSDTSQALAAVLGLLQSNICTPYDVLRDIFQSCQVTSLVL